MTLRLLALLLLIVAASPSVRYFRYERAVLNTSSQNQQTCLALDPPIFTHAGPQLASLRLYRGETEIPYAIEYARNAEPPQNITLLNTGLHGGTTTFDAAMPDGSYGNLTLGIAAKNFIATVHVSGSQVQTDAHPTSLGSYTVFDFTRQKLGRSTVLHLPLSDFRYLHFRTEGPIHPDQVTGISAGPVPSAEQQYVNIVTLSAIQQQGRDSIIKFNVPANVPVDRILFSPGAQPVNFSRQVTVTATPAQPTNSNDEEALPAVSSGNILRLHTAQNGRRINEETFSVDPPALSSNRATNWTVAIHNQDDAPLQLQSVALQMIARTLCFNAVPGATYSLYYGDSALSPPRYDYASLFVLDKNAAHATLAAEQLNPLYQPRPDTRPFTEKHPALLWIALIAAILILGAIALRSSRTSNLSNSPK